MVNSITKAFQNHITKCVYNNKYSSKFILGSAIGLDLYSNIADSIQLGKNKELEPDERRYLSTFRMTNGFVSAVAQGIVGLALMSDKTQKFIVDKASKLSPKIAKTLEKPGAKKNLMTVSSLVGAVVLTKRILVPFITTPIASAVNDVREELAKDANPIENIFEKGKKLSDIDDD